jgi:hypothetical protein
MWRHTARPRAALPLLLLLLALMVSVAACGGSGDRGDEGPSGGGDPDLDPPRGAEELVLRMEWQGGFMTPEMNFSQLPLYSLYGDGRLIYPGPMIEIYPPPAMPNLQSRRLSPDGVSLLLERAAQAGLIGETPDFGSPPLADVPTTVFTVNVNGTTYLTEVYALGYEEPRVEGESTPAGAGEGEGSPPNEGTAAQGPESDAAPGAPEQPAPEAPELVSGLTEEQLEARRRLIQFQMDLFDLESWLEGEAGPEEEYVFEALAIRIAPAPTGPDPSGVEAGTMDWPLAPLSEAGQSRDGYRVGVVQGTDLDELRPQLLTANTLTQWRSDGELFSLAFRPLLPDETEAP